jgi:ribosomal protein S27AE
MRSLVYSNTSKPTRPACPRCNKKGISIWHENRTTTFGTLDTPTRDRNCRYCGYTEFQTFVMNERDFRGTWKATAADLERQASYNGEKD